MPAGGRRRRRASIKSPPETMALANCRCPFLFSRRWQQTIALSSTHSLALHPWHVPAHAPLPKQQMPTRGDLLRHFCFISLAVNDCAGHQHNKAAATCRGWRWGVGGRVGRRAAMPSACRGSSWQQAAASACPRRCHSDEAKRATPCFSPRRLDPRVHAPALSKLAHAQRSVEQNLGREGGGGGGGGEHTEGGASLVPHRAPRGRACRSGCALAPASHQSRQQPSFCPARPRLGAPRGLPPPSCNAGITRAALGSSFPNEARSARRPCTHSLLSCLITVVQPTNRS